MKILGHILTALALGWLSSQPVLAQNQQDSIEYKPSETALAIEESFALDFDPTANMEMPSLLLGSRDAFRNAAAYALSAFRFRPRGLDNLYLKTLMNGVDMTDANTGRTIWALWGGLNDAMRNSTQSIGLMPSDYGLSGLAGSQYLDVRASTYRPGTRLTYSYSNRSYTNRLMAHFATGRTPSGWSAVFSLSKRWGETGYIAGTHYDAKAFFIAVSKEINPSHQLSLTTFMAPVIRGVMGGSTQEVYDLVGSNYYNPNIGYIGDRVRNARVRESEEPVVMLTHDWKINEKARIATTAMMRIGFNGYSALNWIGQDPRPDYYRNLPSYFAGTPDIQARVAEAWRSGDKTIRHIDWDQLYESNRHNQFIVQDAEGNTISSGKRAVYIIEDRRNDQRQFTLSSTANIKISKQLHLDAGLEMMANKTMNFTTVKDLLGADYWYDVDKFAERDFAGDVQKSMSDLNHPYRVAKLGEKFGYNYNTYIYRPSLWGQLSHKGYRLDSYAALQLGMKTMQREGLMRKGLFPENSYGKAKALSFFEYDLRLGSEYKFSGKHYLTANIHLGSHAPQLRDVYVSPRTRHTTVPGISAEKIYAADLSYHLRTPFIKARLTAYITHLTDKSKTISFYDDEQRTFGQYVITGIGEQYTGAELGMEIKISPTVTAAVAASMGDYFYSKNASYEHYVDNNEKLLGEGTVYWKNFKIAGTPQKVASFNLSYNSPEYWYASFTANYAADNYISMNPTLRAANIFNMKGFQSSYAQQENFGSHWTLDANIGASFKLKQGVYMGINLSASNILDNNHIRTGGYEQMRNRFKREDGDLIFERPFDKKYFYMFGRTYFLNLNMRF